MKNRFHCFTLFLLGLLFFIPSFVKADSLTISKFYYNFDTYVPLYLSNKEYIDNYTSSLESSYILASYGNDFIACKIPSPPSLSWTGSVYSYSSSRWGCKLWDSQTNTFSRSGDGAYYNIPIFAYNFVHLNAYVLSSNIFNYDKLSTNYDTIIIPSFTSSVYNKTIPEITINVGDKIPSYLDIYNTYILGPPTHPDNYPILTSFFTTFIDRLSFLCEYISSSYIFLSIFVVLLIYISITLLRRLMK